MAKIEHFECSRCSERFNPDQLRTFCPRDGGFLYVRYDLTSIKKNVARNSITSGPAGMWRYTPVLPDATPVTLGEGFTPMLRSRDNPNLLIKDEGQNPTGTFKARGLGLAVTMARAYGLKKLAMASAGNAAGALAAYAAAAGIEAHVVVPRDVPKANLIEYETYAAHIMLVDGVISDCARVLAERVQAEGWFDVTTFKEPFRVEGKKTMGYEVAEQLDWTLPDAIIYPTGGGVGLIGMWKAFAEMEQLGWIPSGSRRPKMICVQSSGCAPVVKAWDEGKKEMESWPHPSTIAAGLRVPKPRADDAILKILHESHGIAVAVSDGEIMDALRYWGKHDGIFAAPEGAASLAGYRKLVESGFLHAQDRVVLFNTGSGLKYVDVIAGASKQAADGSPADRQIGGIIGPY